MTRSGSIDRQVFARIGAAVVMFKDAGEIFAGVRMRTARNLLGSAGGHDHAALGAAFGAEVDNPIGGLNDVKIVLDDDERSPALEKFAEGRKQFLNIVEMQARRGFIENIKDAGIGGVDQMSREFQALRFAARKRGGGLAEAQIAETDFRKHFEL